MSDPLQAPDGVWWAWPINALYQLDCLIAAIVTGRRNTTISCLLGLVEQRHFGTVWYWLLLPAWMPVNALARWLFGEPDHCLDSVGPFIVEEDEP